MANSGALWQEVVQFGKETVLGTGVAATRKAYLESVSITKDRPNRTHRFKTGTRDNQRAITQGPTAAGGQVKLPIHPDELLEWLNITLGPPVITTPGGGTLTRRHTYKPSSATLDSMTLERNDGSRVHRGLGVRGGGITFDGSVDGDNMATIDLFATDRDDTFSSLTGSLSDRNPPFLEGWQTNFYIDALGATPGTTKFTDLLEDWSIKIMNNMARIYAAGNTQAAIATVAGELDISMDNTFLAESSAAATFLTNWLAGTPKLLRYEFIARTAIETTLFPRVTIDVPGYWNTPDFNKEAGPVRAYGAPMDYVYDATLGAGIVVTCDTTRTAAFT